MANVIKKIVSRIATSTIRLTSFSQSWWALLEQTAATAQGKGWGSGTIVEEVNACLNHLPRPPKLVIDIGANKGLYTDTLRQRCPQAECFLFEPSPANAAFLRNKYANSALIHVYESALSDHGGLSTLFSNEAGSGLASLSKRRLNHFGIDMTLEERVNTSRFEEVWRSEGRRERIDYVKIDVEGHELAVLRGFGKMISEVTLFQFEFGGTNIDTRTYFQDFWYFFSKHDFRLLRITPSGTRRISSYRESDEFFATTNFIALNNRFL